MERAAVDGSIDPRLHYGAELGIPGVKQHTKDSVILEPFTAGRRTTPSTPEPNIPRLPRKKRQARFVLPLLIKHSSGASTKVMACPDSGSVDNIISLELVDKLRLEIDSNEQKNSHSPIEAPSQHSEKSLQVVALLLALFQNTSSSSALFMSSVLLLLS